jgi:hypothetical protein
VQNNRSKQGLAIFNEWKKEGKVLKEGKALHHEGMCFRREGYALKLTAGGSSEKLMSIKLHILTFPKTVNVTIIYART